MKSKKKEEEIETQNLFHSTNNGNLLLRILKNFERSFYPLKEVSGNHSTGKSQLLWAYAIFFRAYNKHKI